MKKLAKFLSCFLITAMIVANISPLENCSDVISSWFSNLFSPTVEAYADDEFSFLMGAVPITNGGVIDYSQHASDTFTLGIEIKGTIPSGASITWNVGNKNVVKLRDEGTHSAAITLDILSPGYSTLSVSLMDADGTLHSGIAYCSIYVPLEWDDSNNILATVSNNQYGLLYAQTSEESSKSRTLQLYAKENSQFTGTGTENWHYLRRLKYINYSAKAGYPYSSVRSDINPDDLQDTPAALEWTSSDTSVVDVDSSTGMIWANHAGFARITVRTLTSKNGDGEGDSKTFNVVVVPEATVVGHTTSYNNKFTVITTPGESTITVQSNARYAEDLNWQLFQGDAPGRTNEITKKYEGNIEVGEATGRVMLRDLPAGVYSLTAIPVKDATAAAGLATYGVLGANIEYLHIVIIVTLNFPVTSLVLNYYNQNVADSYDLLGNSNMPEDIFTFTSSDTTVATVGYKDGIVDATGLGSCHITISKVNDAALRKVFGEYTASAAAIFANNSNFSIDVLVVNGVSLNSTSETMCQGATMQLTLTAPNPYEGTMTWSSNKTSVVTVDETGKVTAVAPGDATVTVKIKVDGVTKRAKCKIKVVAAVSGIQLTSKKDYVEVGDNLTISAVISPKLAGVTLSWSCSDESIASVADKSDLSMTITGVKAGTVVVTAVNQDNVIVGTKIIKVIQEIQGITLSDANVVIPQTQKYYQLYATCKPELPDNQSLKWSSSDTKICTVDANGKVTLVKPGKCVITVVTENGLIANCTFEVTQGVTGIELDQKDITIYVGEKYRMTYQVKPSNATDMKLKWTSNDTKIASVDATGYITGKNVGTTVIIVQATDGSGIFTTCTVTVLRNASGIKLDVTDLKMVVGEVYQLETTLTPADSSDSLIYESSNTKAVLVSKTGKITAKGKGQAVVMVKTSGGLTTYCNVEVSVPVTGIKLNSTEITLYVGEEFEFEATIEPKTASDLDVTWTSNDDTIAKIDKKGILKAISGGTTLVKCVTDDGDYMAYCIVTVIEQVTTIILPEYEEVGVGKKKTIECTVSGEKATNKDVEWTTSNKKICKVNEKGVITGVKKGTCVITATAKDGSGVYAECEVKVIYATEEIEIDPDMQYIEMVVGESIRIKYKLNPSNATYQPLWTSENDTIAVVNKTGTVTALKAGSVIITATAPDDNSVKCTTFVKVIEPIYASSVSFAENELIMTAGEVKKAIPSTSPAKITESHTWSSDNPIVASVDSNGNITAKTMGTANITYMTQSGKKASVKVYVVGLSETNVTLQQYEKLILSLQIDGSGASNFTIRWGTNNQDIAEMTNNGQLVAKALGKTVVYAMVNGRRLECKVTVVANK